jgi:hypothetical protein
MSTNETSAQLRFGTATVQGQSATSKPSREKTQKLTVGGREAVTPTFEFATEAYMAMRKFRKLDKLVRFQSVAPDYETIVMLVGNASL